MDRLNQLKDKEDNIELEIYGIRKKVDKLANENKIKELNELISDMQTQMKEEGEEEKEEESDRGMSDEDDESIEEEDEDSFKADTNPDEIKDTTNSHSMLVSQA